MNFIFPITLSFISGKLRWHQQGVQLGPETAEEVLKGNSDTVR